MSHDSHLSGRHPLAGVAQDMCRQAHQCPPGARIGGVACGRHWEQAIRADATVAEEEELPELTGADLVDEIAVARAVAGEPVPLTTTERRLAIRRLAGAGLGAGTIAERLSMSGGAVRSAMLQEELHHGTYGGYLQHVRRKIPLCDPRRAARREYRQARQAAKRAGRAVA